MKSLKKYTLSLSLVVVVLAAMLFLSQILYKRFDLTADKRYTLSPTTLQVLSQVKTPVSIKVLLKGNIPAEYKRLQVETLQRNTRPRIRISILNFSTLWKEKIQMSSYKS